MKICPSIAKNAACVDHEDKNCDQQLESKQKTKGSDQEVKKAETKDQAKPKEYKWMMVNNHKAKKTNFINIEPTSERQPEIQELVVNSKGGEEKRVDSDDIGEEISKAYDTIMEHTEMQTVDCGITDNDLLERMNLEDRMICVGSPKVDSSKNHKWEVSPGYVSDGHETSNSEPPKIVDDHEVSTELIVDGSNEPPDIDNENMDEDTSDNAEERNTRRRQRKVYVPNPDLIRQTRGNITNSSSLNKPNKNYQ